MSEKADIFKTLLCDRRELTNQDIKEELGITQNSKLINFYLKFVLRTVEEISIDCFYEDCYNWDQLFINILELVVLEKDNPEETFTEYFNKIQKLCRCKKKELENRKEFEENGFEGLKNCILWITIIEYEIKKISDHYNSIKAMQSKEENLEFFTNLVFINQNFNYVRELLKLFPTSLSGKEQGQLIEQVYLHYQVLLKRYLKNKQDEKLCSEVAYYERIILFFLEQNNLQLTSHMKHDLWQKNITFTSYLQNNNADKKYLTILNQINNYLASGKLDLNNHLDYLNRTYQINYVGYQGNLDLNYYLNATQHGEYLDLRKLYTITIDPTNARLLDDALSIAKLPNGNTILGVHIADVERCLEPNSPIDIFAYEQAFTIYVRGGELSMLPFELSSTCCSLNQLQDRRAYSYFVTLDPQGKIISFDIKKSLIRSKKQLSYSEADQILQFGSNDKILEKTLTMLEGVTGFLKERNQDKEFYHNLKQKVKVKKELIQDKEAPIIDYSKSQSHQIVSESMILVNNLVAQTFHKQSLPFIYRVHETKKIQDIKEEVYGIDKFIKNCSKQDPKAKDLIERILLSYSAPEYSVINKPHEGLNLKYYSHTSSPIRRYADLLNQRLTNELIINPSVEDKTVYAWETYLPDAVAHLNRKEKDKEIYTEEYVKILKLPS